MSSSEKKTVFLRESTGLVKQVNLLDAFSLQFGIMSFGPAMGSLGLTMILVPAVSSISGMNLVYASLISVLIMIPMIIVYMMLAARIGRTGGDYVWISRAFGGLLGGSVALSGWIIAVFAFVALTCLEGVFAIGAVGLQLGKLGFLGLAVPNGTPGANAFEQVLVIALIFAFFLAVNVLKPNWGFKLVSLMTVISIVTLLLATGILYFAGRSGVDSYISYVNSVGANVTYSSISSSYSGSTFSLGPTLFILPFFAIFAFPYFNSGLAVGSEFKRNNLGRIAIPIAVVLGTLVLTLALEAMYYAGGFGFINSALANTNLVVDYSFNFWTLAMAASNNVIIGWILGIGWIVGCFILVAGNMVLLPRYFFAMSFDRFLPSRFSDINPRFGGPIFSQSVFAVIAFAMSAIAAFTYGTFTSLYGAVAATMIFFMFVGLSAVVLGLRRTSDKNRYLMIVSGILMALVFVYLAYDFFAYPSVWGGNAIAYGYSAGSFVLGVIIYLVSKNRLSKKGIDISLAFKEIPPE